MENSDSEKNNPLEQDTDEMLDHYEIDYSKTKPNRFARQLNSQDVISVVLEEDVARVFKTSEEVNRVLRALIKNMPAVV